MTVSLRGRVALVTGSSSGIGAAVARRLALEGVHVVVNSRSSVEEGTAVAAEIGGTYLQSDVSDPDAARRLVAAITEAHGQRCGCTSMPPMSLRPSS
jgi:NAD(P)-dependent dehydrogenase (short-subunit alcohol dehydrogenase family)